ncbi:MAG: MFS transporter [Dehalococcoidia bacterium]|nr:MFS transporter [Dehalococcoidia bacterium]
MHEAADPPLNRPALLLTVALAFGQDALYALIFLSYMNHYLLDELHASGGLPGYTLALYGGTKLVVHPIAGRVLDRTTPRLVFRLAIVLQVAALGLLLAMHVLWAFLVATVALGAASAALWPLIYDIVARTQVPRVRTRVTGILSMAGYVATGVGFAAGVLLSDFAPWQVAFLLALVVVGGPLAVQGMGALDPGMHIEDRHRDEAPRIGALRKLASVALFGLIVLVDYSAITSLAAVYGPFARMTLGLSLLRTTALLAPAGVAALAGLVVAARVSRPNRRFLEMSGLYVVASVGAFGLALSTNAWAAAVLAPVLAFGAGGVAPIIAATVIGQGSEGDRGLIIGALMSVEGVGSVIGPAVTAFVIDLVSPRAGIALIGGLFALLVPLTAGAWLRMGEWSKGREGEWEPVTSVGWWCVSMRVSVSEMMQLRCARCP